MSEWISVEERLPTMGRQVLVSVEYDGKKYYALDEWDYYHERPVSFSSETICTGEGWQDHDFEDVTHWMPIPEPPNSDKQK